MELLALFQWLEGSVLGQIGKTYGGVYAIGQSIHLMALVFVGGSVLVTDLRLLGLVLRDTPATVVADNAHRLFRMALAVSVLSGIFMAAAIATRMYYNFFFWSKMTALATGVLFIFAIKRPLLARIDASRPWLIKLVALASLMIWFTVAATGRWIGFSG